MDIADVADAEADPEAAVVVPPPEALDEAPEIPDKLPEPAGWLPVKDGDTTRVVVKTLTEYVAPLVKTPVSVEELPEDDVWNMGIALVLALAEGDVDAEPETEAVPVAEPSDGKADEDPDGRL